MAAGAAELVDHILPHVPIRQWVLSLPHALRYRLAWDHVLCRAVLTIYTRALLGFERRRARRYGRHGRHDREDFREEHLASHHDGGDFGAGAFGIRRPRFLAYKLGLDERQVGEHARILDDLKTERAQAEVDARRATAAFADAISGERFDAERATGGGAIRVTTAEHLRDAVTKALQRLHGLLAPEQRERLAYLSRTGTLQI